MNQQAPDLPKFVQILGRYRSLIALMAVLGVLRWRGLRRAQPPRSFTSQALVIFPASDCPATGAICGGPLFCARPARRHRGQVAPEPPEWRPGQARGTAANGLWVSATARTAAWQAEAATNARRPQLLRLRPIATSYPGEQVAAQLFEPATTATGTPPLVRLREAMLLGALFGALLGVIAALGGGGATIDTPTVPPGYDIGGAARDGTDGWR